MDRLQHGFVGFGKSVTKKAEAAKGIESLSPAAMKRQGVKQYIPTLIVEPAQRKHGAVDPVGIQRITVQKNQRWSRAAGMGPVTRFGYTIFAMAGKSIAQCRIKGFEGAVKTQRATVDPWHRIFRPTDTHGHLIGGRHKHSQRITAIGQITIKIHLTNLLSQRTLTQIVDHGRQHTGG